MPIQAPQWTEFLSCPICCHEFDGEQRGPISLGCGHTVCRGCLAKLQRNQCPYDQTTMRLDLDQLPVNGALLSLVNRSGGTNDSSSHGCDGPGSNLFPLPPPSAVPQGDIIYYFSALQCIKELALLLKPSAGSGLNGSSSSILSRPMQRKLVTLINCQLVEEEGRARAVRAARSLGERTVTELILHHQNHHQLSANLWAAVRSRGCQFLGPAMQEEVLKLVLLALEDGSPLSRKVLVMFVVQRLEPHFPQASKTSIGHVVQLLYRASCFKVSKREGDSSLMQLKEEFRTYEALRREHDAQIVQIATEAGLRIAPDQWSSLLYGDIAHKSHMQSIIDKLQTPQSFGQSVQELVIALQRTGDPGQLSSLRLPLELLAELDPSPDSDIPAWESCAAAMDAVKGVVCGLVQFVQLHSNRKITETHHTQNVKYKTSMCRDLTQKGGCPRGNDCTFAHTEDELEKYRSRNRKQVKAVSHAIPTSNSSSPQSKPSLNYNENKNNSPNEVSLFNQNISMYKGVSDIKKQGDAQQPPPTPSTLTASSQLMSNHMSPQPSPIPPNQILSLHHHPGHASEMMGSLLKNGERPSVLPLINKHLVVEEMIQTGMASSAINPFEQQKFVPVPHSSALSVLPNSASPSNVIRTALPSPAAAPVYATHIPEYAYGAFHPQGPMFAQPAPGHAGPTGLHPSAVGGPPTPVYSPQHPSPFIPELYPTGAQTLLVNHGHVYNIVNPAREFQGPPQVVPCADTRQTSVMAKSISSCLEVHHERAVNEGRINFIEGTNLADGLASKSLLELKERKEELLNQLENIVGKEAIDAVASQIANGEAVSTTSSSVLPEYSPTYSIWTSGANLSNTSWSGKSPEKTWGPSTGYRSCPEQTSHAKGEEFIPFDPPFVSKFGPISRTSRPLLPASNPIQVSACNTTDAVTTPTVHRPVPAISPMPQVVYQHPGFTAFVSYSPSLEFMNTIGHGIIDPPHLHMSQLEPSGVRPSDPIQDFLQIGQEERQRQQFIAAKGGIDTNLHQKFEEMRLKEELNMVMQGIEEKKKEIKEKNSDRDEPDEDMTDFEKNWKFDFDEGEKD